MNPTEQEIAAACRLCEKGFPMQEGVHCGTQSLGMIPATLCENASGEEVAEWIAEQIDNGLPRADIKQQIESAVEWAERRATALATAHRDWQREVQSLKDNVYRQNIRIGKLCNEIESLRATASSISQLQSDVDKFWLTLERGWDIEPREFFEKEARENGFDSPLAMAVHYMWKREVKPSVSQWQIEEFRRQIAEHCQQLAVEFNWRFAGDVASGIGQFVESLPLPAPSVKEKPE